MISVCMATYNGEKYLKEQIDSILKQLTKNDELIISDDMSTDKTVEIIRSYNDNRIKLYIHKENHGYTKNFENALKYANGDYIFLSDQDDIWREDKVSKCMKEFDLGYDFVVSDCYSIDKDKNIIDESRFDTFNIKQGFWKNIIKTRYIGCCMAFNKKVLKVLLPFPPNDKLVEHDSWICLISERYFKVKLLNEQLIYYRRHGENTSNGGFLKGYSIPNKIFRRIYKLYYINSIKKKIKD